MNDQLFTQSTGLDGYKELPAVDREITAINYDAPDTSIEAGLKARPQSGKQRARIYELITNHYATAIGNGLTADEISQWENLPAQSVSARINGLHKDGLIEDSGYRRLTQYGRNAIVWRTTVGSKPTYL